jgi:copper chaperone CopZ
MRPTRRVRTSPLALHFSCLALAILAAGCSSSQNEPAEPVTIALKIEGMHCDGCVSAITEKIRNTSGVRDCTVSLEEGTAIVQTVDPDIATELVEKINEMGYTASPLEDEPPAL